MWTSVQEPYSTPAAKQIIEVVETSCESQLYSQRPNWESTRNLPTCDHTYHVTECMFLQTNGILRGGRVQQQYIKATYRSTSARFVEQSVNRSQRSSERRWTRYTSTVHPHNYTAGILLWSRTFLSMLLFFSTETWEMQDCWVSSSKKHPLMYFSIPTILKSYTILQKRQIRGDWAT